MYSLVTHQKAEGLRNSGLTYDEISNKLKVSKSTLSLWLDKVPFPDKSKPDAKKLYFLAHVQSKGAAVNRLKKEQMWLTLQARARTYVRTHSINDHLLSMSLLSVLYWAEGTKYDRGGVVFTNTDPRLSYLFLDLLRKTCSIDESRLRVRLHLHYYHRKRVAVKYWSSLLGIPVEQFQSTYVKKRSRSKRYRQNFMGICFIKYGDTMTRRKLLSHAYALQEYLAPVAQLD